MRKQAAYTYTSAYISCYCNCGSNLKRSTSIMQATEYINHAFYHLSKIKRVCFKNESSKQVDFLRSSGFIIRCYWCIVSLPCKHIQRRNQPRHLLLEVYPPSQNNHPKSRLIHSQSVCSNNLSCLSGSTSGSGLPCAPDHILTTKTSCIQ